MRRILNVWVLVGLGALFLAATPAEATIISEGVSYTLTATTGPGPTTETFTLLIEHINGPSDTKGGRFGVQAIAFSIFPGLVLETPPSGWTLVPGGLSSGGCNTHGAFFCFSNPSPGTTVLAADSSISIMFSLTATALSNFDPSNWDYHFKIDWAGTQTNPAGGGYDHVSAPLVPGRTITLLIVPEPATLALLGLGLAGLAFMTRRRAS